MEISSITAMLGAIAKATEIANRIRNSDAPLKKAEVKLHIANVISELADAKMEIANIQKDLLEKDQQIQSLKERLVFKGEMIFEAPFYWHMYGDKKEGPYCPACYDKHSDAIRLYQYSDNWWECKICGKRYNQLPISEQK